MKKLVSIFFCFLLLPCLDKVYATQPDPEVSFRDMHLGLFVHYMHPAKKYQWGETTWADGSKVQSLDELANNLDVEDLADVAESMRAQYVIFTTWHANMNALFPSEVMKKQLPGHCSQRDVIRDLINALKAKGIKLVLYIHPSDAGPDFSREDQNLTGWNDGPPYVHWNNFINEVVSEVADRYKDYLSGFYIDGGLPPQVDAPRLRKTILEKMPHAWLIQNSGQNTQCVDYAALERMESPYPASTWLRCQTITNEWWAMSATVTICPELAYKYTVLQASVNGYLGGGVTWSCGPHPGGRWELGVRSFCSRLGSLMDKAGSSIIGTHPSKAFITHNETPLIGLTYAATESADGKVTYVHVFLPQRGKTLKLPLPVDGRKFTSAELLDGSKLELKQDKNGLILDLGNTGKWDDVDTIIELK